MKKILVICGPTATGKTPLGLCLAGKFDAEIVSADSRQVYRKLNIGTGKDLPRNAEIKYLNDKLPGYYEIKGIKVWGYDIVGPKEEFSVAQYVKVSNKVINDIWNRNLLPIIIGGTGFYIKGLIDGIPTVSVPKDRSLRRSLVNKSTPELFEILAQMNPIKAASLNISDRKNPRRLIRAIEVAQSKYKSKNTKLATKKDNDVLFVGLTAPREFINKRIEERIDYRLKKGFEQEIKSLISDGLNWKNQSMLSLGYRQWEKFYLRKAEKEAVIDDWRREEKRYAKMQITWFKKDKRIIWFDITKKNWKKDVEKLIKEWHNKNLN